MAGGNTGYHSLKMTATILNAPISANVILENNLIIN
jgi:hypothetical protein